MIANHIPSTTMETTAAPSSTPTATHTTPHSSSVDEGDKATRHEATADASIDSSPGTMKLVVRSPYWGRVLKGKIHRDYDDAGLPGRPYHLISCQAVLSAVEGQYWGCCPQHGKRVLELREYHFNDVWAGNWDLYFVGSSVAAMYTVHDFILLPQNQNVIDLSYKISRQGWIPYGSANAQCVRLDLEGMLSQILKQNDALGFRYHHVHLEILMNQVVDRETPRSRKAANERSRTDRSTSDSSLTTPHDEYNSGDADGSSSAATTPPIPHVVSNDTASWFSEQVSPPSSYATISSMSTQQYHGWNPHHRFHHPTSYPHAWTTHQQYQQQQYPIHIQQDYWYPASMGPVGLYPSMNSHGAAVAAVLPHMNPAQQLLQAGWVDTHSPIPPFNTPLTHNIATGAPDSSYHNLQSSPSPDNSAFLASTLPEGDHKDAKDALDRNKSYNPNRQNDEKFSEDVATASVSETTVEEDEEYQHLCDNNTAGASTTLEEQHTPPLAQDDSMNTAIGSSDVKSSCTISMTVGAD